eukprot:gene12794-17056_t
MPSASAPSAVPHPHSGYTVHSGIWAKMTIGVLAAWRARRLVDRLVMVFAVMGFALPGFLVAYVLIYVFAVQLGWLPVQGYRPIAEGFWPFAEGLVLPSIALGTTYMQGSASASGGFGGGQLGYNWQAIG